MATYITADGTTLTDWHVGGNAGPVISNASLTSPKALAASNPLSVWVYPQGPNAGAASTATGTPGSIMLPLDAPVSTGKEAYVQITRAGTVLAQLGGGFAAPSTNFAIYGPVAPSGNNHILRNDLADTFLNCFSGGALQLTESAAVRFSVFSGNCAFGTALPSAGGGAGIVFFQNATTNPTTNPAGGIVVYSELTSGQPKVRGSLGAVSTWGLAGSSGTINTQAQVLDLAIGTARTVSSATPTAILTYATTSGVGGFLNLRALSRAATTGTGIAINDCACSRYMLGYRNIGGTVTLSTAGITLVTGSNQTSVAALTAPVLTATVATNVITILVTNQALCTTDSQVTATVDQC